MSKVVVVSKPGCHLCETVIEALRQLSGKYVFEMQVLDILRDKKLHDEYWMRIPVVIVDGLESFEARDMDPRRSCSPMLEAILSKGLSEPRTGRAND